MDEGEIVEFDRPYALMQKKGGLLRKLVEQTGKAETANLLDIAKQAQGKLDKSGVLASALASSQHDVTLTIEENTELEVTTDDQEEKRDDTVEDKHSNHKDVIPEPDTTDGTVTKDLEDLSNHKKEDTVIEEKEDDEDDANSDTEETKLLDKSKPQNGSSKEHQ